MKRKRKRKQTNLSWSNILGIPGKVQTIPFSAPRIGPFLVKSQQLSRVYLVKQIVENFDFMG